MPFAPTINVSTLNGANGFRVTSTDSSLGDLVSRLGDINGDGFDDFAISAPIDAAGGLLNAGMSYVVFGKAGGWSSSLTLSTLDGTNGFKINGITTLGFLGRDISAAGDLNGDGLDDFVIAANGAGTVYVIFGKTTPWSATLDLSTLTGANGFSITATGSNLGMAAGGAQDVNGDGISDIVLGDQFADPGGLANAGSAFVVFGKTSPWAATLAVSALNGANGFRLDGAAAGDAFGGAVALVPDVNGDGIGDIVVGARRASPGGVNLAGSTYVIFGKASGWTTPFAVSSLNGANGFRIDGAGAGDESAGSVDRAGDINGDGIGDLIVGAANADPGSNADVGSVYVVFGKATGWSSTFSLATLNGSNGFRLDGTAAGDVLGFSVAAAGDVNGDGFADLVVSGIGADPGGQSNAGSAYILFGKATGWAASIAVSSLDGLTGFRLDGAGASDRLGTEVSSAGDINRDGFSDVLVSSTAERSGYVLFGDATAAITRTGTTGNDFFGGGSFNDSLSGAGGNDSLLGGAGADTLAGGPGNDTLRGGADNDLLVDSAGVNLIDGEGGIDTFDASARPGGGTIDLLSGTAYGGTLLNVENALGGTNADLLIGTAAANRLEGGGGADTLRGAGGADTLDGGSGTDMASYSTAGAAVIVFPGLVSASTGDATGDIFISIERWELTDAFADTFYGDSMGETVFALGGADVLFGNAGNDSLDGGDGDDFLLPGAGTDTIVGDNGFDAVFYGDATTAITLNLATGVHSGFAAGDTFATVEAFLMTPFGDRVTGADNPSAGDIIYGLGGNDTLIGQGGFDYLLGGDGDDTLVGGFGYDLSTGGIGADRFVFNNGFEGGAFAGGGEVITDFTTGEDKIAFIGATSGFVSFTLGQNLFIQAGGVTGAQGASSAPVLIYDTTADALWFDANGNAAGGLNYLASFLGNPTPVATDFIVV